MVRPPTAPAVRLARRVLPVLTTDALVAALAACGGVSTGGEEPAGSGEAPSRITTTGFGLPDEIASVRVETHEESSGVDVVEGGEAQWEVVLAASVVTTLPMVLLFLCCQRFFVEGIATTGRGGS